MLLTKAAQKAEAEIELNMKHGKSHHEQGHEGEQKEKTKARRQQHGIAKCV
jgi:hypothetical protein